jgi:Tfp pilus assembly protein PilO
MTTIDKKNFQKKILSTVGITFAVLAVFSIVIFFLIEYLDKSIVEIGKKQRLLSIAKAERLSSVSLQNNFKKIENFLPILEGVFPNEDNLYNFISQLESLAIRNGNRISIQITSSKVAVDSATGSNYVAFNAVVGGNYESFKRYLKELNAGRYFVKIDSFSISGNPTINNESTMNLSGKIFIE